MYRCHGQIITLIPVHCQLGRMDTNLAKQAELERWMAANGYEATGPARYAGYDAPWKPAPLRRNEVLIPVAKVPD